MFRNLDGNLLEILRNIAEKKTRKSIEPKRDYIPVTGKLLDADDVLYSLILL